VIGIAANKCDLFEKQQISEWEMNDFKKENGIGVLRQTSAKDGIGINQLFADVAERIEECKSAFVRTFNSHFFQVNRESSVVVGEDDSKKKKKSKCC